MRQHRPFRRAALLGAACVTISPTLAQDGGGLRMTIGIEQRFEVGRNLGLEVPAEGTSSIGTTRLSFGLTSRTPLDTLEFTASSALVIENSPDTTGTETTLGRPDLAFSYTREIPDALFRTTARFRRDDADAFGDDISDTTTVGTRTDYGASIRYEIGRTAPLGFAVEAGFSVTDYQGTTDPGLTDTDRANLDLETRLRISEVLTGTGALRFAHEKEDDAGQTRTETVTAEIGADYRISPRLDLSAALGVTEIETREFGATTRTSGPVARLGLALAMPNGSASADLTLTTTEDEGERASLVIGRSLELPDGAASARLGITTVENGGTDIIGGLAWTRTLPDGAIELSLDRSVSFDDEEDETEVNTVLALGWTRRVTEITGIGLDFSYAVSEAPSERIEQTEVSATYSYALTRDWSLDTGLRYQVRNDADGHAESPSVFVTLGRSFEF